MSILRIRRSNLVLCLLTIAVVLVIAQIIFPTDALARTSDLFEQNPNNDFGGGDGTPDEPGPGKSLFYPLAAILVWLLSFLSFTGMWRR